LFPFIIILTLTLAYKPSIYNETFAVSPSFVRQELTDAPADWHMYENKTNSVPIYTQDGSLTLVNYAINESECKTPNGNFSIPDMNAVSFISDGKTLNSTIWLLDKYQKPPTNSTLDSFRDRLQLIVVNLTNQNITTPDKFANIILYQLSRFKSDSYNDIIQSGPDVIELAPTTIWGYYPAYKIVYHYNTTYNSGDNMVIMDILTVKGNRGYIFNYIAKGYQNYSHYMPLIQQMIDSFGTNGFLGYKDSQLGISIQYPFSWSRTDANITGFTSAPVFYPPFKSENSSNGLPPVALYIKVTNLLSENISLDEIVRGDISSYKQNNAGINLININRTTIAGNNNNPAYKEVYTQVTNDTNDKYMSVITINDSKVYRMTYYSEAANYSKYLPTVEQMIDSFNIINTTQLKNSDAEIEATNLPKYENATFGIDVIYPVNWTVEDGYYNRTADMIDYAKGTYWNVENWFGIGYPVVRFLSPFNDSKPFSLVLQSYDMSINVEPVYNTGSAYHLSIIWDPVGRNWTRQLVETARTESSHSGGRNLIQVTKNITDFLNEDHIPFSLDLHELNYPSKYELFFITVAVFVKDRHICALTDTSNWALIPPPQFNITTSPNSVELRPGEDGKNIEVQIKSDSIEPSQASFLLTNQTKDINATFGANKISIPRSGEATTHLNVKALEEAAAPQQYTLPIEATMSFVSRSTNELTGETINNTIPTNITYNSHLTVVVQPKLDYFLKLLNNLTVWISPLNSIWTFLAAVGVVIIPLILRMFNRNQNKNNKKKSTR
jgi:photosystem II reaction center protein PsbP